jgi:hypothetical protein
MSENKAKRNQSFNELTGRILLCCSLRDFMASATRRAARQQLNKQFRLSKQQFKVCFREECDLHIDRKFDCEVQEVPVI